MRPLRAGPKLVPLLCATVFAACLQVHGDDFPCSAQGHCPAPFVCALETGRCHREGWRAADGGGEAGQAGPDARAHDDTRADDGAQVISPTADAGAIADATGADATGADATPMACDDSDLQCGDGICAIDHCVSDFLDIPYASELPVIDGVTDAAWGNGSAVQFIGHRILGDADAFVRGDRAGEFQLMWNEQALFVRARAIDDRLVHDDPGPMPTYEDDGVEMFVDADASRQAGVSPMQGNYVYNQLMFGYGDGLLPGSFTQHRIAGIEFRVAPTAIGDGYIVEALLPWSALGASPTPGGFIGLDVHINDDDDGGKRDRKWAWFGQTDLAPYTTHACTRARLVPRPAM